MALSTGPRTFDVADTCTLADLRAIVEQTQDTHESAEVRVHVRPGGLRGAKIRQVKILPPEGRTT